MTFEERYGITRQALLREVRRRSEEREEARLKALSEAYRAARIDAEADPEFRRAGRPGSVARSRPAISTSVVWPARAG